MNSLLDPIVSDLNKLFNGVMMKNPTSLSTVRAVLSCCVCDMPATRKLCGFLSFHAKMGCSKCMKQFPRFSSINKSVFLVLMLKIGMIDNVKFIFRRHVRQEMQIIRRQENQSKVLMVLVFHYFITLFVSMLCAVMLWIRCTTCFWESRNMQLTPGRKLLL